MVEEYLKIEQLSERIPYRPQTIRNMMTKGTFKLGVHYVKPNGTGRPIFIWSAVERWLRESEAANVIPLARGGER
ncbi:MAG: helix-turn-helix transcriptional regulator [Candidatus Methylomirabilales bacterium]